VSLCGEFAKAALVEFKLRRILLCPFIVVKLTEFQEISMRSTGLVICMVFSRAKLSRSQTQMVLSWLPEIRTSQAPATRIPVTGPR